MDFSTTETGTVLSKNNACFHAEKKIERLFLQEYYFKCTSEKADTFPTPPFCVVVSRVKKGLVTQCQVVAAMLEESPL